MIISHIVTLAFVLFALRGVNHIYKGKLTDSIVTLGKGILEIGMSLLGIGFSLPIFENFLLSAIFAFGFSVVALGYAASIFLPPIPKTKVWKVTAELQEPDTYLTHEPSVSSGLRSLVNLVRTR